MHTSSRQAGIPQGLIIIAISLLPMMAIVALMPIVPLLVQHFHDVPNIQTMAPLVLSAPGLCVALLSPFAGWLADRFGRRQLAIGFAAVYGIGGMIPVFVQDFNVLLGSRLLLGVGESVILTMGNTLLGDYFPKEQRAKWLMWQGIVGSACGSGLLALSGYLAGFGWNFAFLVYGLALVIAAAAYFFLFEPERVPAKNFTASGTFIPPRFPRALMVRLAGTTLVLASLYFVYTLQFSLALDALGLKEAHRIGNYSAVASFAVPLGAILFKVLSTRRSVLQFTVLFLLLGTGMAGIGLSRDVNAVVAFAFVQQLGAGMCIPILIGWGLRELPDEFRGRGMGMWVSAFFLGQFVSPLLVTLLRGWTGGLLQTFVACGATCIAIAVGNLLLGRRRTPAIARPAA
ncbi:MFS transporter [Pelomonas sp. KK5]|uniref:MFS transporter n=1 Tax=Pelomonas sp. KK5 TaxID=1855730 RepID=UPI00097C54D2|nr:MFS transporter [Pelomonas sp. KK5]